MALPPAGRAGRGALPEPSAVGRPDLRRLRRPARLRLTPEERASAAPVSRGSAGRSSSSSRRRHGGQALAGGELGRAGRLPARAPRRGHRRTRGLGRGPGRARGRSRRGEILPRGTLRELAAALSHADLAVGADTGPARVAAALGVPTVTLFGPSWHGRYGQPPPHANLQGHPACPQRDVSDFTRQPCWYAGACTLEEEAWSTCLEDLPVESVLSTALALLNAERPAGREAAGR
ncbi:glycosyltransferase family 9 protein [Rubrobacter marinus]|uniref:glycosyltransferase family 9 protein n=1 Tax=Rubrobacter marinus TaxID=2653852 RepID=UPI001A9E2837